MSKLPSPTALTQTMSNVDQILAGLGEDAPNELKLGMIEGETTAIEDLDKYLEAIMALELLAEQAKARHDRWEKAADELRTTVRQMMDRMQQTKMVRPIGTVSLAAGPPKVHLVDENLIALQYQRLVIDKVAIAKDLKAGIPVDGATLSNAPPVLRISK